MIPFHFADRSSLPSEAHCIQVPAGLETKADLFAFLSRSIPLPDYFGHNWDALDECLADLGEHDHLKIALVHQDLPLQNAPADQRTYLKILADAARDSKSLSVVFSQNCHAHISSILE